MAAEEQRAANRAKKEAKKERRQAEAAAKAHAEEAAKAEDVARQVAARKAAIDERATTRIQRAGRGLLARRQRAELHRRATLGKRFEAMKNWRHLLSFVFRERGFSLLICAIHAAVGRYEVAICRVEKGARPTEADRRNEEGGSHWAAPS